MSVRLLLRRPDSAAAEPSSVTAEASTAETEPRGGADARALERLDRWLETGAGSRATELTGYMATQDRALLAAPADRLGKGAVRMAQAEARKEAAAAARKAAGELARRAAAKVTRFFAENGQRQALLALSRIPQRTLAGLGKALPAKVEAHILEHTREIAGKPAHSLFQNGTSIDRITDLVRAALRSGARPILSISDNGALAFVVEKEFSNAIGAKGEKGLRLVVDLEGHIVTAFPFALEKKLATLTIRGVTVAASIAPLVFLSALAEAEADEATADADRRSTGAQRSTWTEKVLEFVGPYGIFESSPIAIEPNFIAIKGRTDAALAEARTSLGRELTPDEDQAIRQCVYDVWADAAGGTGST